MRYLGIDYGAKKVGVAVSDESGEFSYPLKVLENSKDLIYDISYICKENNIGDIVVGDSKDFNQVKLVQYSQISHQYLFQQLLILE